jgi:hypothetical protein
MPTQALDAEISSGQRVHVGRWATQIPGSDQFVISHSEGDRSCRRRDSEDLIVIACGQALQQCIEAAAAS